MDANLRAIAAILREAATTALNSSGASAHRQADSHTVLQVLGEVEKKLNQARGAGFVSRRMDSTLLLLREIREKEQQLAKLEEEERARLTSLHAGIMEMLGE